jgi:glycosyltransferase involved in cell wall biosynthesis
MTLTTRKKVLFLITKSNWGGAQRYVYDLATGLDTERFEVVVALGGNGTLAELLSHAGVRVISIDTLTRDISIKKEWAFIKELWHILRTERPDILHVNSSKAGAVGTVLGRAAMVPRVIFTAHGWAFNEDRPWWQRMLIKVVHYITVLCSHRTIAVSNAIVHQMNWPLAIRKMKVINPGRVIGAMYGQKEAREKIGDFCPSLLPHLSQPWIISIAELHPIKRFDVLLEAMIKVSKQFPQAICVIIGEGELRPSLETAVAKNKQQEQIFFTGAITEAARFLKAGTVFVLPSQSESYGYVLHEAGLAHVPVVATNVGGIPDIISSPDDGVLVPPGNSNALASALIETLENPDKAAKRALLLEQKMQSRTASKMINATSAIYELPLN